MLKPGAAAPDFALHDHTGAVRTLDALLDAGPLVLYFYPADATPLCTKEACMFRDTLESLEGDDLARAGLNIAGVSPQSQASHAKFHAAQRLNFPLLADPKREAIRPYKAAALGGLITRRISYLIEPNKTIADAAAADLGLDAHRRFIDRAIERCARVAT